MRRDKVLCQPCHRLGRTTQAAEVDHITNKAQGGNDSLENLQAICRECHAEKTSREGNGGRVGPVIGLDGWPISENSSV